MKIAIDFDGTIVEHRYPEIGKPRPFAFATLKKLQEDRHQLILWTVRQGDLLQEAIDFCHANGVDFYAVNANYPEEEVPTDLATPCRKLNAELYIDDRNFGGMLDWGAIYQMIRHHWTHEQYYRHLLAEDDEETPGFFARLFGKR